MAALAVDADTGQPGVARRRRGRLEGGGDGEERAPRRVTAEEQDSRGPPAAGDGGRR